MKEHETIFTCDNCGKQVKKPYDSGFPYSKGWYYIYILNGQKPDAEIPDTNYSNPFKMTDKHFCSKKCLLKYIKEAIK